MVPRPRVSVEKMEVITVAESASKGVMGPTVGRWSLHKSTK